MKNDPVTGILVGVLTVSVLFSSWFLYGYVKNTRDIRQSQGVLMNIQARRQAINALVVDVLEYSKTHPAIEPLLEASNLKPKPGATATAPKPAATK